MTLTKSFKAFWAVPAVAAALAALGGPLPEARAEGRAIVYNFDGKTSIVRNRKTIPADLDMTLRVNDLIRTEEDAFLDVTLNSAVGVRFMASSEGVIANSNEGNMVLKTTGGQFLVNIKRLSAGSSFRIVTPTATAFVEDTRPGTQFLVHARKAADGKFVTTVVAEKNSVYAEIETSSATVSVLEGQALDVPAGNSIPPVRNATEEEQNVSGKALSVYVGD